MQNLTLWDACGEQPKLWDFAGDWTVLMVTTSWCEPCQEELLELETHRAEARETTGVPGLDWLVVLYQNATLGAPLGEDAGAFIEYLGIEGVVPVLADPTQTAPDIIPWEGTLPGKCLLSAEMELSYCWSGADDGEAFGWLAENG